MIEVSHPDSSPARRSLPRGRAVALLLALGALLGACQDDFGERFPAAQLDPERFVFGPVVQGQTASRTVELANVGGAPLVIERVRFDLPPTADLLSLRWGDDPSDPAARPGLGSDGDAFTYPLRIAPGQRLYLTTVWSPRGDAPEDGAVVLETNLPAGALRIPVVLDEGAPEIILDRAEIDFGRVPGGEAALERVVITNIGQQPATVQAPRLDGSADFLAVAPGFPVVLGSGDEIAFQVRYAPRQEGPDQGLLVVTSDDPTRPEIGVPVVGNAGIPCLITAPGALEFRSSLVDRTDSRAVSLQSCGGRPVTVADVRIEPDTDAAFELVPIETPLVLPPAEEGGALPAQAVTVRFTPRAERLHRGALLVTSDDPEKPVRRVPLLGRGVLNACPRAQAAQVDVVVPPGDAVALDGSPSIDPDGEIIEWRWEIIESAPGSSALPFERPFDPADPCAGGPPDDPRTPGAMFCPEQPGRYRFELRVTDALGLSSSVCEADQPVSVRAVPEEAVHVQLTWRAPGDLDPSDDRGPDADLHLLHPLGNWGELPYDCHYANPVPDWGQAENPADDPILDTDDIGGGGPENVRLALPEATDIYGAPYAVGVEYYRSDDRVDPIDYGPIFVTVRAYVRGELVWTYDGPPEEGALPGEKRIEREGDRWLAFELRWPLGAVITVDRML